MSNELYFLPLIVDAFQESGPKRALQEAFEKIEKLGIHPEYKQGFSQFLRFMAEVGKEWEVSPQEPEETTECVAPDRTTELVIEKNGEHIASIPLKNPPITKEVKNIKPGRYELKLDTGRVLWQGILSTEELIWCCAFPQEDLPLAADTGDNIPRTTLELMLAGGQVIVRVFPEMESGRIEIKISN